MAKSLVTVHAGEVYAIPLFLSNVSSMTRFSQASLRAAGDDFAFMRVISDQGGSGIIIEVLNERGALSVPLNSICQSTRLFLPIVVSGLAIHKRRWPRVGQCERYDPETVSKFSEIELVQSPSDNPILWRGGRKLHVSVGEAARYEPWTIWGAQQVEKRILGTALGPPRQREPERD